MKKILPLLILVPFFAWSSVVIVEHGYFGFLTLSLREPWALQMLLDLTISLFVVGLWMRKDARAQGINPWPYLLLMPFLGSIGALFYLVHRGFKGKTPLVVGGFAEGR